MRECKASGAGTESRSGKEHTPYAASAASSCYAYASTSFATTPSGEAYLSSDSSWTFKPTDSLSLCPGAGIPG